jgi:hypothetical protein
MMRRQENFKTLIRSLRIKRYEKLKISKLAFALQQGKGGEKNLIRSEGDADSRERMTPESRR